jgi:hypothetical protein
MGRAGIDERGFEAVRRIRQTQSDMTLSEFKATVREQFYLLLIDAEAALSAIPSMLPDDADTRQQAVDLICQVLNVRGETSAQDKERIQEVRRLFRVDGQSRVTRDLAVPSHKKKELQAKAS